MKLAYEHLLIIDPDEIDNWEQEMNKIHKVNKQMKERWLPLAT